MIAQYGTALLQNRPCSAKARMPQDIREEMREFLIGILRAYQEHGETELASQKLNHFLTARYGSIADAKRKLGDVSTIKKAFVDIQASLYHQ
ncbi:hypothetical protein HKCCA1065_06345 [Rhodobacterales bacterium HKCCA1065]|nr:hypothetical protein [Rhodobacterales bacterium HKCCA1065]